MTWRRIRSALGARLGLRKQAPVLHRRRSQVNQSAVSLRFMLAELVRSIPVEDDQPELQTGPGQRDNGHGAAATLGHGSPGMLIHSFVGVRIRNQQRFIRIGNPQPGEGHLRQVEARPVPGRYVGRPAARRRRSLPTPVCRPRLNQGTPGSY